jgi:hypothetical protein
VSAWTVTKRAPSSASSFRALGGMRSQPSLARAFACFRLSWGAVGVVNEAVEAVEAIGPRRRRQCPTGICLRNDRIKLADFRDSAIALGIPRRQLPRRTTCEMAGITRSWRHCHGRKDVESPPTPRTEISSPRLCMILTAIIALFPPQSTERRIPNASPRRIARLEALRV